MNRIEIAVVRTKFQIEARIFGGLVTAEKVDNLNRTLNLELDEYVKLHELKSLAVANGRLNMDEGMTVYNYLGEGGPEKFNGQPIEVKMVLTQLFQELLREVIGK